MNFRNIKLALHLTFLLFVSESVLSYFLYSLFLKASINLFLYAPWIIINISLNFLGLYLTIGRHFKKYDIEFMKNDLPAVSSVKALLGLCLGLTWRQFILGIFVMNLLNFMSITIDSFFLEKMVYLTAIFTSVLWILNKQYGALKIISVINDEKNKTENL